MAQNIGNRLGHIGLLDLSCGEFYAQAKLRAMLRRVPLLPFHELTAGLLQNPSPDVIDQAGLLRERDELSCRQQALIRMLPTHERLYVNDLVGTKLYLRLVVDLKLLAFNGLIEVPPV